MGVADALKMLGGTGFGAVVSAFQVFGGKHTKFKIGLILALVIDAFPVLWGISIVNSAAAWYVTNYNWILVFVALIFVVSGIRPNLMFWVLVVLEWTAGLQIIPWFLILVGFRYADTVDPKHKEAVYSRWHTVQRIFAMFILMFMILFVVARVPGMENFGNALGIAGTQVAPGIELGIEEVEGQIETFAGFLRNGDWGGAAWHLIKKPFDAVSNAGKAVTGYFKQQIAIATGDYYTGQVDKYSAVSLGVFIKNIEAAEKEFYLGPVTSGQGMTMDDIVPTQVFADIEAQSLDVEDCLDYDFLDEAELQTFYANDPEGLAAYLDSEFRLYAHRKECEDSQEVVLTCGVSDKAIAGRVTPPNLSMYDIQGGSANVECSFKRGILSKSGSESIDVRATFPFVTKAYIKTYFMDRDRLRNMKRQKIDPFDYYKETDKKPSAVYTGGPIMLGMAVKDSLPLTVISGSAGGGAVSLTNRAVTDVIDFKVMNTGVTGFVIGDVTGYAVADDVNEYEAFIVDADALYRNGEAEYGLAKDMEGFAAAADVAVKYKSAKGYYDNALRTYQQARKVVTDKKLTDANIGGITLGSIKTVAALDARIAALQSRLAEDVLKNIQDTVQVETVEPPAPVPEDDAAPVVSTQDENKERWWRIGVTIQNKWDGKLKELSKMEVTIPKGMDLKSPAFEKIVGAKENTWKLTQTQIGQVKGADGIKTQRTYNFAIRAKGAKEAAALLNNVALVTKYIKVELAYRYEVKKSTSVRLKKGDGVKYSLTDCTTYCDDDDGCFCEKSCPKQHPSEVSKNSNCASESRSYTERAATWVGGVILDAAAQALWGEKSVTESTVTKDQVNAYLTKRGSDKLRLQAETFYNAGIANGIDPAFGIAVSGKESTWGTKGGLAEPCNNFFGLTYNAIVQFGIPVEKCDYAGMESKYLKPDGMPRFAKFSSAQAGVEAFFTYFKKKYIARGQLKVSQLVAPLDQKTGTYFCEQDPRGCYCCDTTTGYQNWVSQVPQFRAEVSLSASPGTVAGSSDTCHYCNYNKDNRIFQSWDSGAVAACKASSLPCCEAKCPPGTHLIKNSAGQQPAYINQATHPEQFKDVFYSAGNYGRSLSSCGCGIVSFKIAMDFLSSPVTIKELYDPNSPSHIYEPGGSSKALMENVAKSKSVNTEKDKDTKFSSLYSDITQNKPVLISWHPKEESLAPGGRKERCYFTTGGHIVTVVGAAKGAGGDYIIINDPSTGGSCRGHPEFGQRMVISKEYYEAASNPSPYVLTLWK